MHDINTKDEFPSDKILLIHYYQGDDEPVGIWMRIKYLDTLIILAAYFLGRNWGDDAIQDVALDLCLVKTKMRKLKLKPGQTGVLGALRLRVRNKSIDLLRNKYHRDVKPQPPDELKDLILFDPKIEQELNNELVLKSVKNHFLQKGWLEDWQFLEVWLQFDHKDHDLIAKELNLDKDQIRTIRQRVIRRLKRFLFF